MKRLLTILLCSFSTALFGQVLKNTNLDLNAGGVIHDVAYDPYYDAYVVVGNFSSINGQARTNLAFIDASTLTVMSQAPVTSIDGAIRSVEVYNYTYIHPTLGFSERSYLYLGGNFTTINGQSRVYATRFSATHVYAQPPAGGIANFNLTTWDANLINEYSNESGVQDLLLTGDTLIVAGRFTTVTPSSYTPSQLANLIAFDAESASIALQPVFTDFSQNNILESIQGVRKIGGRFYTFGKESGLENEFIFQHDQNGVIVQQIENCGTEEVVWDFEPHPTATDTMLFSFENYAAGDGFTSYTYDGTLWHCQGGGSAGNSMVNLTTVGVGGFFEVYKNYIFNTNNTGLYTSKRNGTANVPVQTNQGLNANWSGVPNLVGNACVKRSRNLLFLSGNNLSSVSGSSRTGLAVFCLEPTAAEPFTLSDNTACEGDSATYAIPQAQCADGYRWTYTGSGAMYRITGSGNAWAALTSNTLMGASSNSIDVLFPQGSTGGMLSVEPYTQFASDQNFSQAQTITISVNSIPDISLAPTHTLNCYSDTTLIVAQSSVSTVNFSWSFNNGGGSSTNDTILITQNNSQGFVGDYIVTLTNYLTGCVNRDTTYFSFDLTANPMDVNLITTNPNEWNCTTDSLVLTSNQTGYLVQWEDPASPGVFYSDPFTIYSAPNSTYTVLGMQLSNGCNTQESFGGIVVNQESATPILVGHPNFVSELIDDSLNCFNPSITLECDVEAAYLGIASAQWYYQGSPLGTNVLNLTTADSAGMDGLNLKYYTIVTTHNTSQCVDSTQIIVRFDFDSPIVPSLVDQTINCSQSSIVLTHPTNGLPSVTEGWLDGSGTQTNSNTITATTGEYYYQVQSTQNGCTNADTVTVVQSLDLLIDMPQDTLICPEQTVTISPVVIGNTETPSFVWSTGATSPSESVTGGIDSELIVTISTPSGCVGTDTTHILITAPVNATLTPFAGCTDGSLEITSISGGAGNYQYSLDGTTWQTSTNFPSLSFGTYTVFIQDDLGCVYDTTAQLDGTASTIEMLFGASTYNEEGDTIILVNITDFTGLDSIAWNLPPSASVSYQDDSIVILSIADSGWYDIELLGYLGTTCTYSYIAPVFFGGHAPNFEDSTTLYGIVDFSVYPNPLMLSNSNTINIDVELGKTQNYTILVTNSIGQPIPSMSVSGVGKSLWYQLEFPLGTAAGTYRVHVICDYDAKQQLIVLTP